jgi:hypothetical protein
MWTSLPYCKDITPVYVGNKKKKTTFTIVNSSYENLSLGNWIGKL